MWADLVLNLPHHSFNSDFVEFRSQFLIISWNLFGEVNGEIIWNQFSSSCKLLSFSKAHPFHVCSEKKCKNLRLGEIASHSNN